MTNVVQPISPMILPKITPPPGLALTRRVEHSSTTVKAVSESDPAVYSKTGIVSSNPQGVGFTREMQNERQIERQ